MKTLRLKVKRNSYKWLNSAACEVNFVWNWAAETSEKAIKKYAGSQEWLSGFDLCRLSAGSHAYFNKIRAGTIQCVNVHYAAKRRSAKKTRLRWRSSNGPRRALGWVPFKGESLIRKEKGFKFSGKSIRVFEFEKTDGLIWSGGQFSQDSMGDWWLSILVESKTEFSPAKNYVVGIDLGLKDTATTSDGDRLAAGRYFRDSEKKLSLLQKRGHKRQAKRLHRRISRKRKDSIHKFTTGIIKRYQTIAIGDVSSSKLVKTRMAKSVLDSGWGMLKQQLLYKGECAGRTVEIVNEAYTSRTCSSCGSLSGPKGVNGLRVRDWICMACGVHHDRDVNAALNISKLAPRRPASVSGNDLSKKMSAGYQHRSIKTKGREMT